MAVTLDTQGTSAFNAAFVSTVTCTNTVGSGSNRALIVQLCLDRTMVAGNVGVVWDPAGANQALTLITTAEYDAAHGQIELWGLVNPTTGAAKNITASWSSTTCPAVIQSVSYTGVNQTGGTTSFVPATPASGTGTASIVITSATGNATLDVSTSDAADLTSPTQTQTLHDSTNMTYCYFAGSKADGAATVTHQWTHSGAWASVGCNVVAASTAAAQGSGRTTQSTILRGQPQRLGGLLQTPAPRVRTGRR